MMSVWGAGSDENEWTHEVLGLPIKCRFARITIDESSKLTAWSDLQDGFPHGPPLGVVVWLVKQDCLLPVDILESAITSLKMEVERLRKYTLAHRLHWQAQERLIVAEEEILMLTSAVSESISI